MASKRALSPQASSPRAPKKVRVNTGNERGLPFNLETLADITNRPSPRSKNKIFLSASALEGPNEEPSPSTVKDAKLSRDILNCLLVPKKHRQAIAPNPLPSITKRTPKRRIVTMARPARPGPPPESSNFSSEVIVPPSTPTARTLKALLSPQENKMKQCSPGDGIDLTVIQDDPHTTWISPKLSGSDFSIPEEATNVSRWSPPAKDGSSSEEDLGYVSDTNSLFVELPSSLSIDETHQIRGGSTREVAETSQTEDEDSDSGSDDNESQRLPDDQIAKQLMEEGKQEGLRVAEQQYKEDTPWAQNQRPKLGEFVGKPGREPRSHRLSNQAPRDYSEY